MLKHKQCKTNIFKKCSKLLTKKKNKKKNLQYQPQHKSKKEKNDAILKYKL